MTCVTIKAQVSTTDPESACDFLALHSGLSKAKIKDAMNKGAVWLAPVHGKAKRLRRATSRLSVGDRLEFHYDPELLARTVPMAVCVADCTQYSVWYKPPGVMAQGTQYGDHCALLRQVEQILVPVRPVLLVHRLDREAAGLMLVAHTATAAAQLSRLFQDNKVYKRYRVEVRGRVGPVSATGDIAQALDDRPALTHYTVENYDAALDVSTLSVVIETGRKHQIRRHLEGIGYPVMGDPRYGSGNKNSTGLRLVAVEMRFADPWRRKEVQFLLDTALWHNQRLGERGVLAESNG